MKTLEPTNGLSTTKHITIAPPNILTATFTIKGTAPLVCAKFSEKAKRMMMDKMEAGSTAKTKKQRDARDFDEDYRNSLHISGDGWCGMPAGAFRAAMIRACSLVGFHMTMARLSVFVEADGIDATDGTPLVRIDGEHEPVSHCVRNATGVADVRVRAMFRKWSMTVRVRYDADQFTLIDVANLLARAGAQVGIGEGRPGSKSSNGMGWGTFELDS